MIIDNTIEIFENWLNDSVTVVDGIPVITVQGLIEMKQELGRRKDLEDIKLIQDYYGTEENG